MVAVDNSYEVAVSILPGEVEVGYGSVGGWDVTAGWPGPHAADESTEVGPAAS